MAVGLLDFWIDWASQIGVLLSLFFQIILHLFANIRRRSSSSMLRVPFWLAYQLSDMTATYAAGQLLYSSSTPQDHQLIAFWAPFLLLHLGGPDNITAYALEDNKLWKRHFLSLGVQVLGAGYVLYTHIAGSGLFLTLAAILVFVVGVAKYGERTCALWLANFSSLQSSLKHHQRFYIGPQDWYKYSKDELALLRAHSLFHICKHGIVDSVIEVDSDRPTTKVDSEERKIILSLRDCLGESTVLGWQDVDDRNLEEVVRHHGAAQHAAVSCRTEEVMKHVQEMNIRISRNDVNTLGLLRHKWGKEALNDKLYKKKLYKKKLYKELKTWHGVDFHESIISWHIDIATDVILAEVEKRKSNESPDHRCRVKIVRALSNYLMFLLVNHPGMLPGLPQNWLYKQTCNNLDMICNKNHLGLVDSPGDGFCTVIKKLFRLHHHWDVKPSTREDKLAGFILALQDDKASNRENPRLKYARNIAKKIEAQIADDYEVRLLLNLWTDFLAYAANRCSRESHAKKLSSGGEFTTIVWLMIEHLGQLKD
ncbi:unnamed protein product [Alopecurus aequalis]